MGPDYKERNFSPEEGFYINLKADPEKFTDIDLGFFQREFTRMVRTITDLRTTEEQRINNFVAITQNSQEEPEQLLQKAADMLRAVRMATGLSQLRWSFEVNAGTRTVQRWELAKSLPNLDQENCIVAFCISRGFAGLPKEETEREIYLRNVIGNARIARKLFK